MLPKIDLECTSVEKTADVGFEGQTVKTPYVTTRSSLRRRHICHLPSDIDLNTRSKWSNLGERRVKEVNHQKSAHKESPQTLSHANLLLQTADILGPGLLLEADSIASPQSKQRLVQRVHPCEDTRVFVGADTKIR